MALHMAFNFFVLPVAIRLRNSLLDNIASESNREKSHHLLHEHFTVARIINGVISFLSVGKGFLTVCDVFHLCPILSASANHTSGCNAQL